MAKCVNQWPHPRHIIGFTMVMTFYATMLIAFQPLVSAIGFSTLRPATIVPFIGSFLVGPMVSGLSSALGGGLADAFSGYRSELFLLCPAHFLLGFLPFKLWRVWTQKSPVPRRFLDVTHFLCLSALVYGAFSLILGWSIDFFDLAPFGIVANLVFVNNWVIAVLFCPMLLALLYPRRFKWSFKESVSENHAPKRSKKQWMGCILMIFAIVSGFVIGNVFSWQEMAVGIAPSSAQTVLDLEDMAGEVTQRNWHSTKVYLMPSILMLFMGTFLLSFKQTS